MTEHELHNKIKTNTEVSTIADAIKGAYINSGTFLTGGALVDIAAGKTPKDFDLVVRNKKRKANIIDALVLAGYRVEHKTSTAITLIQPGKRPIQVLNRTDVNSFDFTIAQGVYIFEFDLLKYFDYDSYHQKKLFPTECSFNSKTGATNALGRLPHWKNKGFELPDITFLNMLRIATKETINLES